MRMRKTGGGLAMAAALLLTACAAPAPPPDPAEEALLSDFRQVTYGAERPGGDRLAKWEIPIRAAFVGESEEAYREEARRHLADLGALTGLEIAEAAAGEANLLIFFADDPFAAARRHRSLYAHRIFDTRSFDDLIARMEQSATCFGLLWGGWPSGRTIDFSVVFIRTGLGARTVKGCLVQETAEILGPRFGLDPDADSVFSDSGKQVDLTPRDRLFLQILYDPRLKPGMGWAEAEPLARAALRELRSGRPPVGG
ncbi:DUF2927 domain-containing protein [Pelagibius sp. CAU 1746]|uniref:DUF2927 domain-containing protein n=1 Tax=Pelagibius sp. CAU 1746 TaxID=3140370 RepID=UPI00325A9BC0